MESQEPVGTTPLPLSSAGSPVRIWFDDHVVNNIAQEVEARSLSNFSATYLEEPINGSLISTNGNFIVYVVKSGLIRILHRHSTNKLVMRGHSGQTVTDVQFFNQDDVFGSVAGPPSNKNDSSLIISRVSMVPSGVEVEHLLEFRTNKFAMSRLIWHPFDMNQICMIHTDVDERVVGTLLNTNAINTTTAELGPPQCLFASDYCIKEGVVQVKDDLGNLTDLAWACSERHILSTHDSGCIVLWDWKKVAARENGYMAPTALVTIRESTPVTRCLFLPHKQTAMCSLDSATTRLLSPWTCFLTASENNAVITLWSAFTKDGKEPTKLQVFGLEQPATSYIVDVCYGQAPASGSPLSTFVVMSDRTNGKLFAWHLRAAWRDQDPEKDERAIILQGCDYVVPFRAKYPTFSWHVRTEPSVDMSEEQLSEQDGLIFDIFIDAYQSEAIQRLKMTSMMLLPPEYTWMDPTVGVLVERMWPNVHSAHVSEIGSDDGLEFDEEYDVKEDGEFKDDEYKAPDASALPLPNGLDSPGTGPTEPALSSYPFNNWLGSVAAKEPASNVIAPLPPPLTVNAAEHELLADPAVLAVHTKPPPREKTPPSSNRSSKSSKTKKSRKTSPKPMQPLQILQRKDQHLPEAASPASAASAPRRDQTPVTSSSVIASPSPLSLTLTPENGQAMKEEIRRAVREEIQASTIPALKQAIQETVQETLIRPIQSSVSELARQGVQVDNEKIAASVAESVDAPLRAAFASNMKTALLPALDAVIGQVLQQVSNHLEQTDRADAKNHKDLEAMSAQLSTMTGLVAKLTTEFQELRGAIAASQQQPQAQMVTTPPKPAEDFRTFIMSECAVGNYDVAFNTAMRHKDFNLTLFCCEKADINDVFGGDQPKLDQLMLLCVMQHLAQVVRVSPNDSDLDLALQWLQEIALSLNQPSHEILSHVRVVRDELVRNINSRMAQGDQLRRSRDFNRLLQIVRGIQC